jgi:DNA-directed RNA polymerase subunit F
MSVKKSLDNKLVNISEVLDILDERKKGGELGYEQSITYEYASKFAKLKPGDAKKMKKELENMGLEEKLALKVIEIMPEEQNLLKLILAMDKNRAPADEETIGKILGVVKSYAK